MEYKLVCPCIFGLEKIVGFELRRLGVRGWGWFTAMSFPERCTA